MFLKSCVLEGPCDLKIKIFKSCNSVVNTKRSEICSISYGFQDIGQFNFPRSCDLEESCDLKLKVKSCYLIGSNPTGVKYLLHSIY